MRKEHADGCHAAREAAHPGHPAVRRSPTAWTLIEQEWPGKSGVSGDRGQAGVPDGRGRSPKGYLKLHGGIPAARTWWTELEPYWADFTASGASGFGDYLVKRGDEVSEALLSVSDARARRSERPVIIKAYGTVRGSAGKHIVAALPNVGALVEKYALT